MKTSSSSKAATVTAGSKAVDGDFKMQVARLATKSSVTSAKVGTGDISTVSSKADSFEYSREVKIKIGDGSEVSVDLKDASDDEVCTRINNALGKEFAKAEKETVTTYSDADGNALTFNEKENKYYSADGAEYTGAVTTESKEVLKKITFSSDESFEISGSSAGLGVLGFNGTAKSSVAKDADGKEIEGYEGEPIAAALKAAGLMVHRYTKKEHKPRGIFCAIGRCTDCVMVVDGVPNVRTCITPLVAGMDVRTQYGVSDKPFDEQ